MQLIMFSRQKGRTRECMIVREKQYSYLNKDLKRMLRERSLFDMDMIFDRFPREIFPPLTLRHILRLRSGVSLW